MTLALKAVARPGDTIAIESPTYFGLLHVLEALDLKALELPTDAEPASTCPRLSARLKPNPSRASCRRASTIRSAAPCRTTRRSRCCASWQNTSAADRGRCLRRYLFRRRASKTVQCSRSVGQHDLLQLVLEDHCAGLPHRLARCQTAYATRSGTEARLHARQPALPQAALADLLSCGGYDSHLRRIRRIFAENIDQMIRAVERAFRAEQSVEARPAGSCSGSSCRSRSTPACCSTRG